MWIDISTWALKICLSCQVRVSEYNNIRSQLNAINRKQTGRCRCFTNYVVFKFNVFYFLADLLYYFSLAVRDLSNLVKPEDIITSEHLTTLLAIVSKYSQKDWLESYETLTSYVVRYIIFTRKYEYYFLVVIVNGLLLKNPCNSSKHSNNVCSHLWIIPSMLLFFIALFLVSLLIRLNILGPKIF